MRLHFIDGTYELFRMFYGAPPVSAPDGREVGATRALMRSLLSLLRESQTTHVACAFDTVIESFRNTLFAGYKTGEGIDPKLWAQFPLAERATRALGITVWPMTTFEADDALASAVDRWQHDRRVTQILLCSPDKDLAQCVQGNRVVLFDRRRKQILDEQGIIDKFGVPPRSIADWLALVGDAADGIPGIPRWGAKSSALVLHHYGAIEQIPLDPTRWLVSVRGAKALAQSLKEHRELALLYRQLTRLRTDVPITQNIEELQWRGAHRADLTALCEELGDVALVSRVKLWLD